MSMIQCVSCVARIPEVKAAEWNGQCPRCQGKEQTARKPYYKPANRMPKGYVKCACCTAKIPESMAKESEGKCPRCCGVQQKSRFSK